MTEQQYDNMHNEGYTDGYNPIREARIKNEMEIETARPKTLKEQKDAIRHQINIRDCSIARESGTFKQTEIDDLRTRLKDIEDKDNAKFIIDWPLEVVLKRRATWNASCKAGGRSKVTLKMITAAEHAQGWTLNDLRRAMKIHLIK